MPNESYDVFVSYAHADNEIPQNATLDIGWVTALAANLNTGPNVRKKKLFIDHQLKPGDEFSDDLITKVRNSRLLILLLSQNYIDSKWCGKELEHFIQAHSSDTEKPSDVFVVELFPFDEFVNVPENILKLRKHLIQAKFWLQPTDTSAPILSGYPTPQESGEKASKHYWLMLNELRTAMDGRLRHDQASSGLIHGTQASQSKAAHAEAENAKTPGAAVLLADVTDDLESQRNEVKLALQAEGITVLPDGDYVGLTSQEFDTTFAADLGNSECFVQLLSPVAGRKGKGFAAPLPQLQFQLALATKKPILQWCQKLPGAGQISDPAHAGLFATEFIRAINLENFKAEIIDYLRAQQQKREKIAKTLQDHPLPIGSKKIVFIDDLASQPEVNQKLRATIKQQHYDIRSVPLNAPLGNNGLDIKEFLRPCLVGMTIYTDPNKYATAFSRLTFFLNQIAEANLPLVRWGVYLHEGDVISVFGIDSEDVVPVNEHNLLAFLQGLSQ